MVPLTRHILTHTREKPYRCQHRAVARHTLIGNLKAHTRTHNGERPLFISATIAHNQKRMPHTVYRDSITKSTLFLPKYIIYTPEPSVGVITFVFSRLHMLFVTAADVIDLSRGIFYWTI